MSAGGSGEAAEGMSHNNIIAVGLLGGLIGIYAAHFLGAMLGPYASFLGGLGAIAGVVWGAAAVRRVASYGLGTGVPSIGMIALGMGIGVSVRVTLSISTADPQKSPIPSSSPLEAN